MARVTLYWENPDEDPSTFHSVDDVFMENGIARVDGVRHVGVQAINMEVSN